MPRFAIVGTVILTIFVILIAVTALLLTLILENPETYRDQISTAVKSSTGYELTIGGQLSWRYWPPIALEVRDIAIKLPGDDSPLASLDEASINLNLLPLLTGSPTINVQGLSLHGLTLRPRIDKEGHANWARSDEAPATAATIMTPDTSSDTSSSLFTLEIEGIDISDVTVDFLDESTGEHYILEVISLMTGPVQFDKPVTLEIEARARDVVNQIRTITSIQGTIVSDENLDRLSFTNLSLSNQLHLPGMNPVVATMTLNGELDIEKNNLQVHLSGTLDDSAITGSLELNYMTATTLIFDLTIDAIDVSHYLASSEQVKAQPSTSPDTPDDSTIKSITATQSREDSQLIPAELLSAYDLQGSLIVHRLDYDTYSFSDLDLKLRNSNGKFHATTTLSGYDGHASIEVDTFWRDEVRTTLNIQLKQMDMSKLTEFEWITGRVNLDSKLAFQGVMMSDAMETLDGTTRFMIKDGTLDITPVKQLAATIDSLRGKQSSISEWPDKMSFEQLTGYHDIRQGTRENQRIDFTLENIQATGKGGFDYFSNHLQYDIAIRLNATEDSTYKVSPALANIRWPLHCEGAMDASPVDLCFPDSKSVEKLVKDIAKQELKRKGQKELDKLLDKQSPGKLKDLLKGLFKR